MQRIYSIDYLRGIMAMSIMLYHYKGVWAGEQPSETLLGKLGIYGVSIFYIISGISLFMAYGRAKWDRKSALRYATRRVFRIAPLYWVACAVVVLYYVMFADGYGHNLGKYLSNLLLIFGFYKPYWYIPTGGWSIGNEMVFYLVFPFLIIASRDTKQFLAVLGVMLGAYVYFAFFGLNTEQTLAENWRVYIHPFNQVFLFGIGVTLGLIFNKVSFVTQGKAIWIGCIACLIFYFYPVSGDLIYIVTGINRLAFTAIIAMLCFSVMHMPARASTAAGRLLKYFGDISYSMYLLHGAVMIYSLKAFNVYFGTLDAQGKFYALMFFAAPVTILLASLVYRYIEQPLIRVGRRISTNAEHSAPPVEVEAKTN